MAQSTTPVFPHPPRATGRPDVDLSASIDYMWQLYQAMFLAGGVLQTHDFDTTFTGSLQDQYPTLYSLGTIPGSDADLLPYFDAPEEFALTGFTAYSRTLLDDATDADWRNTLGLGVLAVQDVVAVSQIDPVTDQRVIGRYAGSAGAAQEITIGASLTLTVGGALGMADMAQATIKGRASGAGTGAPQDLTAAQVAAIVNASIDHGLLAGLADDDHTQYLRADGTRALAGAWSMGSQATTNVNIDSGVMDNTAIGNTTRSTGKFTTVDCSVEITSSSFHGLLGGGLQVWKDAGPSAAMNLSMAVPGGALTNDMIFSTYSPWTERLRIASATGLATFANAVQVNGAETVTGNFTANGTTNIIGDGVADEAIMGHTARITGAASGTWPRQMHGNQYDRALGIFNWENAAFGGAWIALHKSRSATTGTWSLVSDGDWLGGLLFYGAYTGNVTTAAWIASLIDGTPSGSTDMPGRLSFATTPDASGTAAERLRIDNAGRGVWGGIASVTVGNAARHQVHGTDAATSESSVSRYSADANGPMLALSKSRHATIGSNTIVQSGDVVGQHNFYGANGSSYDLAAQIVVEIDGTPGASSDMPGRMKMMITPDGSATPLEAMRLTQVASAVNCIEITGAATGNPALISARGSDTDIGIRLKTKGAGLVQFGTHSAIGAETVTGYITVKDDGGTDRKMAVVS